MSLAEKLIYLRKKQGLTQMELAEKLNVSRQAISRWEVGAAVPSIDNLVVLSKLYCVSVDYLLKDEISENANELYDLDHISSIDATLPKYRMRSMLFVLSLIIIVIAFVLHYMPIRQDEDLNQNVLIDDLYVETDGAYANGTFVIE